jgi:hypothetical protein
VHAWVWVYLSVHAMHGMYLAADAWVYMYLAVHVWVYVSTCACMGAVQRVVLIASLGPGT